jgi:hypothetical protein
MIFLVDSAAKEIALRRLALPECLHIPIAARDEAAIKSYVGEIEAVLAGGSPPKAFLIKAKKPPAIDPRLPIWEIESSRIFHQPLQVWVHVAYTRYRHAYKKAFPREPIDDKVLSHLLNRRIAALKGFTYVRLTPTARACNSSSALSEGWGLAMYSKPDELESHRRRGVFIQYADLADLLVMMNIKIGGGLMEVVNEAQALVRPKGSRLPA